MRFRDVSIRWKVLTVTMVVTALALLLAAAAFTLYDQFSYRERLVEMVRTQMQTVGINCRAALAFNDPKAGEETLAAFGTDRAILEACLYDKSGTPFAVYRSSDVKAKCPGRPGVDGARIEDRQLELFEPIQLEGRRIGTIYVRRDLSSVYQRMWLYAGIAAFVLVGAALAAFVLASLLQRLISAPILDVARTTRQVAETKDYSLRVPKQGRDEIGQLSAGFNEMLDRIEEATRELRRREELLSSIAGNLPGMVYRFYTRPGGERGFYYVSSKSEQLFGVKPDLEGFFDRFIARIHPDDVQRFVESSDVAVQEVRAWECEARFLKESGETIWIRGISSPVRIGDDVVFNGIILDITGQRKAEAQLRRMATVVEQAVDEIVVTDATGAIVYVNRAFEKATGYARNEVIGRNPRLLKSGRHDRAFYHELWQTISTGRIWTGILVNKRKDGQLIEEDASIGPLLSPDGRLEGFVSARRDVTERRQLEERLRRSQRLESIGQLAGGVAHDFNNLLVPILGYSELLLVGAPKGLPGTERLELIHKAAVSAKHLTQQLLAFGRKSVLEVATVDLSQLVREFEKMMRRLLREDIVLRLSLAPKVHPIKADVFQIEQVLMNLLVNARDAMPNGGVVTIDTRDVWLDEGFSLDQQNVSPGPYVQVSVSDDGSGMNAEVQARIFEPFFSTKELGKGTGLGLATAFGIVKQHGGVIWAESEEGKGSTFRVCFPRSDQPAVVSSSRLPAITSRKGTETVLIVEDDGAVRELANMVLKEQGYTTLSAASPTEALAILQQEQRPVHLLLTDVIMPYMNGKELYDRVKAIRPGIRVLYMSGYTGDSISRHGVLEEGVCLLQKPFTMSLLSQSVRDVLDG